MAYSKDNAVAGEHLLTAFSDKFAGFRFGDVLQEQACQLCFISRGSRAADIFDSAHLLFVEVGDRLAQKAELYAFSSRGLVFRREGRDFCIRFVINNRDVFSAAADGSTRSVHSYVACADYDNIVACVQQRFAGVELAAVSEHNHTQEVGCGDDTGQLLAGDIEGTRQGCAGAHEDGVVALGEEVVDSKVNACQLLRFDFYADML